LKSSGDNKAKTAAGLKHDGGSKARNLTKKVNPVGRKEKQVSSRLSRSKMRAPLKEEPVFRKLNLDNLTDDMLRDWKVQDLNRELRGLPKDVRIQVKKERRTLKNRVYAHNSRNKKNSELKECKEELSKIK
jgi:hypothetical protein